MECLITESFDIWTTALESKINRGKGRGKKSNRNSLYGIKKLRELILDLAVRGKLVPQNPDDEPTDVLLEKIANEKVKLLKEGKIKKQKKLSEISDEEKEFELPVGWEWVRLGEISEFVNGYAFKSKDFSDTGIGIVKIGDIQNNEITTFSMSRVNESIVTELNDLLKVVRGDLLIAMSGATTGKLGFNRTNEEFYLNQRVGKISPYLIDREYIFYPLTTKIAENLAKSMGSAIPNLSTTQIKNIVFALPPLGEQLRIVIKVKELMTICDRLEQHQIENNQTHQALVETLLTALTNTADHDEFIDTWGLISDQFDTLFTTEDSINQLQRTILQLAVMGKLVSQDPKDESAYQLLKKITDERSELVRKKEIKKQQVLPEIQNHEKPFEIPDGWVWAQTADLCSPESIITYGILKPIWSGDGILTVRIKDMINGSISMKEIVYCTQERASKFSKTTLIEGDLLIAKDGGTLGKTAFVPKKLSGGNITQHILRFSVAKTLSREFVRIIVDSPFGQNWMKDETKGAALPGVNVSDFRRMPVGIPPYEEQKRIVKKTQVLLLICDKLQKELEKSHKTAKLLAQSVRSQKVGG